MRSTMPDGVLRTKFLELQPTDPTGLPLAVINTAQLEHSHTHLCTVLPLSALCDSGSVLLTTDTLWPHRAL